MTASIKEYRFEALSADGSTVRGIIAAESVVDARRRLDRRALLPVSLRSALQWGGRRKRLTAAELSAGLRILAELLDSGLTLTHTLQAFAELAPAAWTRATATLQEAVREGASLSSALRSAPVIVPPLMIGIIRAGEHGDGTAPALRRAAEHAERSAQTSSELRAALSYPFVIAVAGTASVALLLGVVLPRFALMIADLGQTLPRSTQILLAIAGVGAQLLPWSGPGVVAIVVAAAVVERDERLRLRRSALLRSLPLVGPLRQELLSARLTAALGLLLAAGVPIRKTMELAADAVDDASLSRDVRIAAAQMIQGDPLSLCLERSGALRGVPLRLIRAGERSGNLAAMCSQAAHLSAISAERSVRNAVRLVEPLLILGLASVVAAVAVALLQAVYAVRPT